MTRAAFLAAAAASTGADCVLCPFAVRASSGYGAHSLNLGRRDLKRNVDAHVHACTLAHGDRPTPDHQAAHSCGEKLCCNGSHLRWATRVENMRDAIRHGTLRGGGRGRVCVTPEQTAEIRASSESLVSIGRRLGIDPAYVGVIRRGARAMDRAA